jgi:hypothetical protein
MEALKSYTVYYKGKPVSREAGYTKYHALDKAYTNLSQKYKGIERKNLDTKKNKFGYV